MQDKIKINRLLDFYGKLLTLKQQDICQYYYRDDLSLQEISELESVSRAAVYDTIKRCKKELLHYESILHLVELHQKRQKIFDKIKKLNYNDVNQLLNQCNLLENEGENV